jgi:hypothetical protein
VTCPQCGKFKISRSSEIEIARKAPEQKRAILENAKKQAAPGELPFIRNI